MAVIRSSATVTAFLVLLWGTGVAQNTAPGSSSPAEPTNKAGLAASGAQGPVTGNRTIPVKPKRLTPVQRGDILMARKMYRDAIETYREGIHNAALLYNKIGIAYHQLSDFKPALKNYNMALRLNPQYPEALNNIGAVYYAQGKMKRAIKQYRKALKYAPMSASIYSNLGTAYFARKKYKKAVAAYRTAIQLDPNVFEHRNTMGSLLQEKSVRQRAKFHFYMAKTYAHAGMTNRALLYMRKALEEGFRDKKRFLKDPDFKALQKNPKFQALLARKYRVL